MNSRELVESLVGSASHGELGVIDRNLSRHLASKVATICLNRSAMSPIEPRIGDTGVPARKTKPY